MRLDKFLVEMGVGSRSQVKEMAKKGRINVNGVTIKASDTKIDEKNDLISVDGQTIGYTEVEYYMLNKPAGVVSATEDRRDKTVIDLIESKQRKDLFPVGRLDKDTEGLLLITNDGDLAHRMLSPKKHVDKVYFARIDGKVTPEHVELFAGGLTLNDGTKVRPGELEILSVEEIYGDETMDDTDNVDSENDVTVKKFSRLKYVSEIRLTIHEGKFHQVKRMFEAVGTTVTYLKRLSMGPLVLDDSLSLGEYRKLTEEEISKLKEL